MPGLRRMLHALRKRLDRLQVLKTEGKRPRTKSEEIVLIIGAFCSILPSANQRLQSVFQEMGYEKSLRVLLVTCYLFNF